MLKPLDLVVGLKAHLWSAPERWSFERLALAIGVSASQAHTSLRRLEAGGLYRRADGSLRIAAFTAFARHGVPVVFPVQVGPTAVGMPTAHAAPPLSALLVFEEAYVWPTGVGLPGASIVPLHPIVPRAAATDAALYQALALLDALRVGRARERHLASEELERLLAGAERDARWMAARREAQQSR